MPPSSVSEPAPILFATNVPPVIAVPPEYVLTPDSTSVPALSVTPPVPPIEPENTSFAFVSARLFAPRFTTPVPASVPTL